MWNLFYNVAEKYGVVPREVMPETAHSNNTTYLRSVLNERLRAGGYELRGLAASGADRAKIAAAKIAVLKGGLPRAGALPGRAARRVRMALRDA